MLTLFYTDDFTPMINKKVEIFPFDANIYS